jgi:hypothetical protein
MMLSVNSLALPAKSIPLTYTVDAEPVVAAGESFHAVALPCHGELADGAAVDAAAKAAMKSRC